MSRHTTYLFLLLLSMALHVTAQNSLLTDKHCYLAGERLHVSLQLDDASRVAYIELADTSGMVAQAMTYLTDGSGWAEIALPSTLHNGNFRLTAYTRLMLRQSGTPLHRMIAVVNPESVTTADDVLFLPLEDSSPSMARTKYQAGKTVSVDLPHDSAFTIRTLSVVRGSLDAETMTQVKEPTRQEWAKHKAPSALPELEGHIVVARPQTDVAAGQSRLVMIGKGADVYDGQRQDDGTWLYYTTNIHGTQPTLLNGYTNDMEPAPMQFVSPYVGFVPNELPTLKVRCTETQLRERFAGAKQESAFVHTLAKDTLAHNVNFLSRTPEFFYDMDEYTHMNTVNETLTEFVKGIKKRKLNNVTQLFIRQVDQDGGYSKLPALVMLDGMPVYDVEALLNYDARLLKYIQIYNDTYTFGQSICDGVIQFISKRGRMSNYELDKGSKLVAYDFPQDHPVCIVPQHSLISTVYWNPSINSHKTSFPAPAEPGIYQVMLQGVDRRGEPFQSVSEIEVLP